MVAGSAVHRWDMEIVYEDWRDVAAMCCLLQQYNIDQIVLRKQFFIPRSTPCLVQLLKWEELSLEIYLPISRFQYHPNTFKVYFELKKEKVRHLSKENQSILASPAGSAIAKK